MGLEEGGRGSRQSASICRFATRTVELHERL